MADRRHRQDEEYYEDDEDLLDEEELEGEPDPVMALLAASMPWVISLLFHIGIFLLLLFMIFIIIPATEEDEVYLASNVQSKIVGGKVTPIKREVKKHSSSEARKSINPTKNKLSISDGKTSDALDVTGIAGGGQSGASGNGLDTHGAGLPNSSFFGGGGKAYNIVYVIDRSGSMIDTFDAVRREMKRSIFMLDESQYFHVIFYSSESIPKEFGSKKLVPANRLNKKAVTAYLQDIIPSEQTDPVPALRRAFEVFKGAKKQGFLVYLLTDGLFPDNEQVLSDIRTLNGDKKVQIFTYLYGHQPPAAVEVMEKIATENNGGFVPVESIY